MYKTERSRKMLFYELLPKIQESILRPKSGRFPELKDEIHEYVRGFHYIGVSVLHKMLHFKSCETAERQDISP
jgi:hypothetical protein